MNKQMCQNCMNSKMITQDPECPYVMCEIEGKAKPKWSGDDCEDWKEGKMATEGWELFSERLKNALNETGISYRQLSARTGITTTTICRYANCQSIPRATEIFTLAEALNVTPEYLLGISRKTGRKIIKFEGYMTPEEGLTIEQLHTKLIDEMTKTFPTIEVMASSIVTEED